MLKRVFWNNWSGDLLLTGASRSVWFGTIRYWYRVSSTSWLRKFLVTPENDHSFLPQKSCRPHFTGVSHTTNTTRGDFKKECFTGSDCTCRIRIRSKLQEKLPWDISDPRWATDNSLESLWPKPPPFESFICFSSALGSSSSSEHHISVWTWDHLVLETSPPKNDYSYIVIYYK